MTNANRSTKTLLVVILCLSVLLAALLAGLVCLQSGLFDSAETPTTAPTSGPTDPTTRPTDPTTQPTDPTTQPTDPTEPTEPPVEKVSSATITATGDMLMHSYVYKDALQADGTYDFTLQFGFLQDYVQSADYAIANLETTLAGAPYSGYPNFCCPDGIVSSLQSVGFDMLLTANNHTYDKYSSGFFRTQQVIKDFGMDYLGTISSLDTPLWQIKEINGIRIGMICYTYEVGADANTVSLNGIVMNEETKSLIGTFYPYSADGRDAFYAEMEQQIAQMEAAGAEAIVLYIHWGEEYQTTQNSTQSTIAQKMCDLGVDVIVGGHPHVIQPMALLTSNVDADHKTVCLYSTGNAISNQNRLELPNQCPTGHTEDGILFTFSFAKYSDGTVILESADVLPTWVYRMGTHGSYNYSYKVIPLDIQRADWQMEFGLSESVADSAWASYERTMAIVGNGLSQVQAYLSQLVADTEAALGVTN